jgi:hypothetical protein
MLFRDMTKAQRKRLRELAAIAYRRQLAVELAELETDFTKWRAGKLDALELSERIHAFHDGPFRVLHSRQIDIDLEIDGEIVSEDRIVGLDEPALCELVRVDVEEQGRLGAAVDRKLAQPPPELAAHALLNRRVKHCGWA